MNRRLLWAALAGISIAIITAALWWALTPLGPGATALAALESDDRVAVTRTEAGWEFAPRSAEPTAALVFYPGGRVDARSYAAYAREVAERGPLVIVVPMPLSLAVLSPMRADVALEQHPRVETWVIGGHSLGGAMAARYADRRPSGIDGLLLLAAYPPGEDDLTETGIAVIDVVATEDSVLDGESWTRSRALLPADTEVVRIEGGNHAQFGDYGPQPGDSPATITADEQRAQAVEATIETIARASRR